MKVMAAEKNLENARVKMQNAIAERKIHEKLKENAFDEFIKEEGMKEAKEIDEDGRKKLIFVGNEKAAEPEDEENEAVLM